ncbi:hypothetical protein [Tenacibaculum amylolyticum]|uniref:hypothetical protein n=1 Tax=Tenacibaculum amylolyticum TaxID=104269 RepID=UPI0038960E8C
MMEDKNINRLFQEKLKDFEVQPDPRIWSNIEEKLSKKKKRRVIPIWWFASGIASVVILGLFLFIQTPNENLDSNEIQKTKENPLNKYENIVTEETIKPIEKLEENTTKETTITTAKQTIQTKKKEKEFLMVEYKIASKNDSLQQSDDTVKGYTSDTKIAMEKSSKKSSKDTITEFKAKEKGLEKQRFMAEVEKVTKEETEVKEQKSRWSIAPVFGLVASNSFTKASAIDATLNQNKVSSRETLSYGVNIAYKINEKWSIRSGAQIQKVNLETQNVAIVSGIPFANNLTNIEFSGGDNLFFANTIESVNDLSTGSNSNIEEGNLQQEYSYIEFPLEATYHLFSSDKFETNIVSGFSTLVLNRNTISANSSNFNRNIGAANNLNTLNFSANLGLEFRMNISDNMKFHVNPMFKAQLNTFLEGTTNAQPYTIGVYSGLIFDF